jgi:hypothetical protein
MTAPSSPATIMANSLCMATPIKTPVVPNSMIPKMMPFFVLDAGKGSGITGAWASLSQVG